MRPALDRMLAACLLAVTALAVAASLCPFGRNPMGAFGSFMADGLVGLLGVGAVLVPLLLLDGARICVRWRLRRLMRIAGWAGCLTLMCVAMHLAFGAGGMLGEFVGGGLYVAIGVGAYLLCMIGVLAVIAYVMGRQRRELVARATERGRLRLRAAWDRAGARMAALPRPADLGEMRPPPHTVVEFEPEPAPVRAAPAPKRSAPPPLPPKAPEPMGISGDAHIPEPKATPAEYTEPPTSVFAEGDSDTPQSDTVLKGMALALAQALLQRGIPAVVKATVPGPLITRYDVETANGTPVRAVVSLAQDLSVALKLEHDMVIAPVRGTGLIGFSLPNKAEQRRTIYLRPLLESEAWRRFNGALPLVLGRTPEGEPVFRDLAQMPHMLVAGATDSGKSVCLNVMLCSLLMKKSPEDVRIVMVDPKRVELNIYADIPHLLTPVVTEMSEVSRVLQWTVDEMERRYKRIMDAKARNVAEFNAKRQDEHMSRIVIVIDEVADLLAQHDENEELLKRLAQKARACGINLIVATQRPSVKVLEGDLKANLPGRIALRVTSDDDSQVCIDEAGAEKLFGFGDMWVKTPGAGVDKVRAHGAYVSTDEVIALCDRLRANGAPQYDPSVIETEAPEAPGRKLQDIDATYDRAVQHLSGKRLATVSTSKLQRALNVGHGKAADVVARLVDQGVIGPYDARAKCHRVLMEHAEGETV